MSLTEGPPDLPYPKLPFWDAVSLSYSTYFRHFTDSLRASWIWLIVVAAFTGYASWQQWSWVNTFMTSLKPGVTPGAKHQPLELAVLSNVNHVLLLFAGVSIAVAWHRLVILSERPAISGSNVATKDLWRYTGMAIALFLIVFLPAAAILFSTSFFLEQSLRGPLAPPPGFFALLLLGFVLYAVGTAVALRLTLLLPARAIGDTNLTFKQTWNRTRGNIWRLFWGVFVTTVPPLLIVQIAFLLVMPPLIPGMAGENVTARMTAISTISAILYLLIVPIGIGFLSHAYRHFFQAPLELPE
jgi:hypothetical protein